MKKTGQITIETAGTAVQGPSTPKASDFMVSAHPDNTGNIAYGNDGNDDVTMSNGYVLKPGKVNFTYFFKGGSHSLDVIWFDADNDGDKVCWIAVE
jgi:hypothetical protein